MIFVESMGRWNFCNTHTFSNRCNKFVEGILVTFPKIDYHYVEEGETAVCGGIWQMMC